jgi:hypothetical protein
MTEYDNTNRGGIWPNKKKEKDTQADFTGSINVDGHDYWLDAWKRKPGANPNAASLNFKVRRKDGQPKDAPAGRNAAHNNSDRDDEIPF